MLYLIGRVLSMIATGIVRFLRYLWHDKRHPAKTKISLLVPFRTDNAERERNWSWLKAYWETQLPDAEIIIGTDDNVPFCKTSAVNDAFSRSSGDIIVILDADCYIDAESVTECARRIREARKTGKKLWFIPYRRFYRLTERASEFLLNSEPDEPYLFADPPPLDDLESTSGVSFGHWYGALIQIMPREAFVAVGGMDTRFRGWGSEDISFMHAVDTLFARHKTYNGPAYHVCHPTIQGRWKGTRQWAGQQKQEMNDWLSWQYDQAAGDYEEMKRVVFGK